MKVTWTEIDEEDQPCVCWKDGVVLFRLVSGKGRYEIWDFLHHTRKDERFCQPCSNGNQKPVYHEKDHVCRTGCLELNTNVSLHDKNFTYLMKLASGKLVCPMPNCNLSYVNMSNLEKHLRSYVHSLNDAAIEQINKLPQRNPFEAEGFFL